MPSYARTTLSLIFVTLQSLYPASVCVQLNATAMNAIVTPELKTLLTIFEKYGFKKNEIRLAGGAVRDLLDGRVPADLDLATVATPQEMKEMFDAENIHMLNVKGEMHGTITVRINNKENFEISTLREQTKIDGAINNIDYIKDWLLDSARRDFTINAMYLDFEGNLYDYQNGYKDLKNNIVRIIGDANERIKEDPILILRYFRFFGRVAKSANHNHDEKVLQAVRDNAAGLNEIFGERIWSELQRILSGNFVKEIVKLMLNLGLAPHVAFGENPDDLNITCFDFVSNLAGKYQFQPLTLVASLLTSKDQMSTFYQRMKLSRFARTMGHFIIKYKNKSFPDGDDECFKYCQRILIFATRNQEAIRAGVIEVLKIFDRGAVMELISEWTMPQLQIDFGMLKEKGIVGKNQVGHLALSLKEAWFDNAYVLDDDVFTKVVLEFQNKTKIV